MFERHSASALIVLPAEGTGVKLNAPAEVIWESTRAGATTDHIVIGVASFFDTSADEVRPFVVETLDALRGAGGVTRR